ncbi:recombination regulator RecX [Vandammella animalimorsus]|uniref:Regulatory protein RecX n=1 Tax=Vandammella animalimorsus TaxID=2029117 RepID=A0A3M6RKK2_9BURK|nr:recombination regulator RecX [Vandammella animalimorsus]RMX15074.1 recombination regulator RecX [Vandammella animalimorsus]
MPRPTTQRAAQGPAIQPRSVADWLRQAEADACAPQSPEAAAAPPRTARGAASVNATPAIAPAAPAEPSPASGRAQRRTAPSLGARALRALARREYGTEELRRKLAPHAGHAAELDALLQSLQAKGLLSDARAAASMARQKASRYGSARIQRDLLAKGLERELVHSTLADLQQDEWQRAQAIWQARFGAQDMSALDAPQRLKLRAKQARFMLARGFPADMVRKLLDRHDSSGQGQ